MSALQLLNLIGVPAICAFLITNLFLIIKNKHAKNKQKKTQMEKDIELLKCGVQAQLRAQMINDYNYWKNKGYAPVYARDNFENLYQSYHNLGANGVMTDIHDKFFLLPTFKTIKNKNSESYNVSSSY